MNRQQCEHGVFLCVFGIGLLIKGQPGIGKSTLALELVERGHSLVSDDIVNFTYLPLDNQAGELRLAGKSPYILKDLLAVRDLGILNITELFPPESVLEQYPLDLVIELVAEDTEFTTTFTGIHSQLTILDHIFPLQYIHAHPKRNLSVIVETAVKNYILNQQNNDALSLIKQRQQETIAKTL